MNNATEKIKRNFMRLLPEEQAEVLAGLWLLAESGDEAQREHLTGVYDTLKKFAEDKENENL